MHMAQACQWDLDTKMMLMQEYGASDLHPGVSHGVWGGGLLLYELPIGRALGGARHVGGQGVYELGHHD